MREKLDIERARRVVLDGNGASKVAWAEDEAPRLLDELEAAREELLGTAEPADSRGWWRDGATIRDENGLKVVEFVSLQAAQTLWDELDQLRQTARFALSCLSKMTTRDFEQGADKSVRNALARALRRYEEETS